MSGNSEVEKIKYLFRRNHELQEGERPEEEGIYLFIYFKLFMYLGCWFGM